MTEKSSKKRLTLTGNKIPDEIYSELEQLGADRKLTPYIVNLIEKEKMMDKLIESLSTLTSKVEKLDDKFEYIIHNKIDYRHNNGELTEDNKDKISDEIPQGDLKISDKIVGGIDEPVKEYDF